MDNIKVSESIAAEFAATAARQAGVADLVEIAAGLLTKERANEAGIWDRAAAECGLDLAKRRYAFNHATGMIVDKGPV